MDLGLQGARVLVTAASQGLGAATAQQFSIEGATVVINSRNAEKLQLTAREIESQTGNRVYSIAADITDPEAARQLIEQTVEKIGGLDVLVVNAGGPPAGNFTDFDLAAWQQATELLLFSAVSLIQAAIPHLKQSPRAAILTITSISARQPIANLTLSNTLRPSVIGLTKSLSLELAKDQIRVNSILPGTTDTERVLELNQARANRNGTSIEEEYSKAAQTIPLGRIGQPSEFANAAVFLCSPAAAFITGVALPVDGGAIRSH
ncbi:MAG: SDR family oxidoreductase [Phototrophicaceae bacterium]